MARVDPDKTVYIYGVHTELDKTIVYVGCSVNPARRLGQHIGLAKQGYAPKALGEWLIFRLEAGDEIVVSVLETCKASESPQAEMNWIDKVRDVNPGLFNHVRRQPYCCHIIAGGPTLEPITTASPGDAVLQVQKVYIDGLGQNRTIASTVIKTGWRNVLIGGPIDGIYKERWVSQDRLYQPKEPTHDQN